MINISDLTEKDIGRWVAYKKLSIDLKNRHGYDIGRIKSFNYSRVFVVYRCNSRWHKYYEYTGCPTNPNDLIFLEDLE